MNATKSFDSNIRLFNVTTLISLILLFILSLFFTLLLLLYFLIFLSTSLLMLVISILLPSLGWGGIILIMLSRQKIKKDYNYISSSYKKCIVGLVLIILDFSISYMPFRYFIPILIIFIISIIGFSASLFFLRKAKLIFNENPELILKSKDMKETEKLNTLYCPRCKTKVKGDSNSCNLCNQDFNEFPAITREEKSFRYVPTVKKM